MGRLFLAVLLLASLAPASDTTSAPAARPLPRVRFFRKMAFNGLRCENATPPVPISTPDPMVLQTNAKISLIVGIDGRVYGPLMLDGPAVALRGIRQWRFRPATCNGVPAEAEGTVEFRLR